MWVKSWCELSLDKLSIQYYCVPKLNFGIKKCVFYQFISTISLGF